MKALKVLKFTLLIIGMLLMSATLEAQPMGWCQFNYPTNGATLYCPVGQTSMDINFQFSGTPWPDQTGGLQYSGWDGVYYFTLSVDGSYPPVGPIYGNNYDWGLLGVGNHTATLNFYEFYYNAYYETLTPTPLGPATITFTIKVTPTHGSCSCPVSRHLSAGPQSNSQTSAYISPGSNVSWSLSYDIFNEYWNNSIPCTTTATAQIGSPLNQSLTATASGNYQGMQDSRSSTYTYTAGGTLTLSASVSIGSNASGGSALATISW